MAYSLCSLPYAHCSTPFWKPSPFFFTGCIIASHAPNRYRETGARFAHSALFRANRLVTHRKARTSVSFAAHPSGTAALTDTRFLFASTVTSHFHCLPISNF